MKKLFAPVLIACAVLATAIVHTACSDAHASPAREIVAFELPASPPGVGAALDIVDGMPAQYNNAGNHVFAELDALAIDAGAVTTVVDGGGGTQTAATLKGTGVTAGSSDGSGCITASATTGKFTVSEACGAGRVQLEACFGDVVGGAAGQITRGQWYKNGSAVGPILRKQESSGTILDGGTLGAVRGTMGCAKFVTTAAEDDYFDFRFIAATAGQTVTTRQATLSVVKLRN